MATPLFANNVGSTLASAISSSATSMTVVTGAGALFPSPTSSQYFVLTLISSGDNSIREIVHVTNVSTDTFTIVRAQEGTSALAWSAGDLCQMLITAGIMELFQSYATAILSITAGTNVTVDSTSPQHPVVSTIAVKNNYSATSAPSATDDSSKGYGVGSGWIDSTTKIAYKCFDPTVSHAVWHQMVDTVNGATLYGQLSAANSWTNSQSVTGNITATGTIIAG